MEKSLYELLRRVDTPSVRNAIGVVQGHRGFASFTRGSVLCSAPEEPAMVGYALTTKIAGVEPPTEDPDVIRKRRMDYYRYMAEGSQPSVTVIEDTDYPHCISAYWGEVNTTVHKEFGILSALTNGVMRDLGDLPDGVPMVAGSIGPSHGFVHVKDFDCSVKVFGMTVRPGDLIHADRHGALIIPELVIPYLEAALNTMFANEKLVLDPARKDGFNFKKFEAAWSAFEVART